MRVYTVHEAKDPPSDRLDRAEALRFVREGFSWPAAVFGGLWMLVRGFWLAFVVFLLIVAGLSVILQATGANEQIQTLVFIALQLIVGFEADTIERWTLQRQGYEMVGTVSGRDVVECERRFFDSWLPDQPILRPETLSVSQIRGSGEAAMPLAGVSHRPGGWR